MKKKSSIVRQGPYAFRACCGAPLDDAGKGAHLPRCGDPNFVVRRSPSSSTKRAALYARVSRVDQSVDLQLDECRALAKQRAWTLVETYRDEGISGAKERRPELDRMLDAAKRGRFDVLIVWKGDRLFRSLSHMVETVNYLVSIGVDFVSVTEPFDTASATGRFVRNIFASFAEMERDLIRERVRAGLAAARRRGRIGGRPRAAIDVERGRKLLSAVTSQDELARKLRVSRRTLLRYIPEARFCGLEPSRAKTPPISSSSKHGKSRVSKGSK